MVLNMSDLLEFIWLNNILKISWLLKFRVILLCIDLKFDIIILFIILFVIFYLYFIYLDVYIIYFMIILFIL